MTAVLTLSTPADLSEADRARWIELQRASRTYESPYFHPDWAAAVDRARGGVLIAVARDEAAASSRGGTSGGSDAVAFWPFERQGRTAVSVGTPLSDYQGAVAAPGVVVDPRAFLRKAGVRRFRFDHLIAEQPGMDAFEDRPECSPYLDLTGGIEAYLQRCGKNGRRQVKTIQKKQSRLVDDHGPVVAETDCRDPEVLEQLLTWKSAQYLATGLPDIFAADWTRSLLHDLLARSPQCTRDGFSGRLSALRCNGQLIAAHFGLRCGPVVHWWFPSYDESFGDYSPGWQLLVSMIEASEGEGIDRIDLGKGMSQFKRKAMSGSVALREGVIEHSALARNLRHAGQHMKERVKQQLGDSTLRSLLQAPARWLFHQRVNATLKG